MVRGLACTLKGLRFNAWVAGSIPGSGGVGAHVGGNQWICLSHRCFFTPPSFPFYKKINGKKRKVDKRFLTGTSYKTIYRSSGVRMNLCGTKEKPEPSDEFKCLFFKKKLAMCIPSGPLSAHKKISKI